MLWLTWTLLALALAGIVVGVRGKVIAREPRCGRCGYVLTGIAVRSPRSRCPECGGNLWLSTALRAVRTPRRGVIRAAIACLSLAPLPVAVTILERLGVLEWRRYVSVERLKHEIETTTARDPNDAAWAELTRRRNQNQLSWEDEADIASIALDRHLSMMKEVDARARPWDPPDKPRVIPPSADVEHARWIRSACVGGDVSSERVSAYVNTLFHPMVAPLAVAPESISSRAFRVRVELKCEGLGGFTLAHAGAKLEIMSIDGHEFDEANRPGTMHVFEVSTTAAPSTATDLVLPLVLEQGSHLVLYRLTWGVTYMVVGRGDSSVPIGSQGVMFQSLPAMLTQESRQYVRRMDISR